MQWIKMHKTIQRKVNGLKYEDLEIGRSSSSIRLNPMLITAKKHKHIRMLNQT